jgi:hypothetical protein
VLLLREPSDAKIRRFLDGQRSLPFSYPEVGASRDEAPPGYGVQPPPRLAGHGTRDLRAGGRGDQALEDVRDGVDQTMLVRRPHLG